MFRLNPPTVPHEAVRCTRWAQGSSLPLSTCASFPVTAHRVQAEASRVGPGPPCTLGLREADPLLALVPAERVEERVAGVVVERPRRIHRAPGIEAVVQLPAVSQLVHRVPGDLLEP